MGNRTPLYETHVASGAKIVDFGGWDMPLNYGSQIEEHHAVRRDAGMFDVSHMCPVDIRGGDARAFLRHLVANNVDRLAQPGKALYSCMLNPAGGVVDDLIIYFLGEDWFRVVVNASTAGKDLAWMEKVRSERAFSVKITPRRDLAMIAIQGPNARAKFWQVRPAAKAATENLGAFFAAAVGDLFVARTGYTGEDGFEVMLPAGQAAALWADLKAAGVAEAGLGARDTLRLEAGMNLYGNDMDETTTLVEAGLGWIVKLEKGDFIGRDVLERQQEAGVERRLVGFELLSPGIARHGHSVLLGEDDDEPVGHVTSGTRLPSLGKSMGMVYLPAAAAQAGREFFVDIRDRRARARVVELPFYSRKKKS